MVIHVDAKELAKLTVNGERIRTRIICILCMMPIVLTDIFSIVQQVIQIEAEHISIA